MPTLHRNPTHPSLLLFITMQYNYSSWYPRYSKCATKSIVLDLSPDFVEFLHEEGINVCSSNKALPQRSKPTEIVVEGVDYDPDDMYSSSTTSDSVSDTASDSETDTVGALQQPWHERFPDLHTAMEAAIQQLGGQVAPKLNWSSPTDAVWMSPFNSLKCCNADQVILLLKSSDRVMHDLEQLQSASTAQQQAQRQQQQQQPGPQQLQQQQQQVVPQLVLRRWHDLLPEREFRCFVHNHSLVGISQRDPSQHFPQLCSPGDADNIRDRVLAFHHTNIGSSFPADSYAMDVYVAVSGPVKLIDFNPICSTTSPLLFSWDELPYSHMHTQDAGTSSSERQQQQMVDGAQPHAIELRVVQHAGMILPGSRAATGMPIDMLGLQDSFDQVMHAMQQQVQQQQ